MKKILFPVLILFLAAGLQAEEKKKTNNEYIADLKSDDNATVIKAAKALGDAKAKEALDPMIEAIKSHQDARVRISLASGLGNMETKKQPTTSLAEVVKSDDDNSVVYASLLAILNLKDFENPSAKEAVEFCEKNKADDDIIMDVVKRINEALGKNKK